MDDATTANAHPSGHHRVTVAARRGAYNSYVQDQLRQERATSEQAQTLHAQAPKRIRAMTDARTAAGLPAQPSKDDDSTSHYHVVERMLDEQAYYPPHDKRTESPAYAKVHHLMTVVDDQPCLVCGVKHSTLANTAQNPFGAVQMETHHHSIEWALANGIDAAKFNARMRPGLARHAQGRRLDHPEYGEFDAAYGADMTDDQIHQWVDHAYDNLWVLCDVHHRHKFVGIHGITYPIWGPQDVVNSDMLDHALEEAKSTKSDV
ncbi:hypothetical protein [Phenylobacterium sp.]|uniref:hypothetical protein n=1 Tax=Phenylobacterium sp. TaxID=1871053 RepID=UPI00121FDC43|nr:hypothetical protein [Phenylobacterium sp.]THD59719.1 MAG: hypothetical protein E8A49_15510 [Phenylobacterium sp.]